MTKITSIFPYLLTLAYLVLNDKRIDRSARRSFLPYVPVRPDGDDDQQLQRPRKRTIRPSSSKATALLITLALFLFSVYARNIPRPPDGHRRAPGRRPVLFSSRHLLLGANPCRTARTGNRLGIFYGALIPFILIYIKRPVRSADILRYSGKRWGADYRHAGDRFCPSGGPAVLPYGKHHAGQQYLRRRARRAGQPVYAANLFKKVRPASLCIFILRGLRVGHRDGHIPLSVAAELILLVTLIPVQKNIRVFYRKQVKEETLSSPSKTSCLIFRFTSSSFFWAACCRGLGPAMKTAAGLYPASDPGARNIQV